jgi:hypothetical protein
MEMRPRINAKCWREVPGLKGLDRTKYKYALALETINLASPSTVQ